MLICIMHIFKEFMESEMPVTMAPGVFKFLSKVKISVSFGREK